MRPERRIARKSLKNSVLCLKRMFGGTPGYAETVCSGRDGVRSNSAAQTSRFNFSKASSIVGGSAEFGAIHSRG